MLDVEIQGLNGLESIINDVERKAKIAIAAATTDVVAMTHDLAVQRTPMDTGLLRETSEGRVSGKLVSQGTREGAVQVASVRTVADEFTATVGYTKDYAPMQHEVLTYKHTVGQAKFLESAAIDRESANVKIYEEKLSNLDNL